MINIPPHAYVFGDAMYDLDGGSVTARSRAWLLVSYFVAFAACAAAIWLAAAQFLRASAHNVHWTGVALVLSNLLVLASASVYRFQRAFEHNDDF
eukprot:m51a1_g13004 hypothetical protein (95) ;mRNA; r:2382-2741